MDEAPEVTFQRAARELVVQVGPIAEIVDPVDSNLLGRRLHST